MIVTGPLCTRASLTEDFRSIGLHNGAVVLLHASLSSLGWVCGGAEAIVLALFDVLGTEGTLVVPTQSSDNSDPAGWSNPPIPQEWWEAIRAQTPAYDPLTTRTRMMGVIAETVHTWPGAVRSAHPQTSFAAVGRLSEQLMAGHALDSCLGEQSPLAKLEEVNAFVMLLGVGFERCTTFHLAEARASTKEKVENSFAITTDTGREWMTVMDVVHDDDDFAEIGKNLESTGAVRCGID